MCVMRDIVDVEGLKLLGFEQVEKTIAVVMLPMYTDGIECE